MKKRVFITGFMGVGKTTVGRLLTERLGSPWQWVDTDVWIEEHVGLSVSEIFQQRGESEFRQLEKQAFLKLRDRCDYVISLGGGILTDVDHCQWLQKASQFESQWVSLLASVETLEARSRHSIYQRPLLRPLLCSLSLRQRYQYLAKYLSERIHAYQLAPLQVHTDSQSPDQIVEWIIQRGFII